MRTSQIADRLRAALEMRDMTQSDLQRALSDRGFRTSYSSISSWFHGSTRPESRYLPVIADALDVSTDYLLGRSDDPLQHRHRPPIESSQELRREVEELVRRAEEILRRLG